MFVEVRCEITANGERFESVVRVEEEVWNDPSGRASAQDWVRTQAVLAMIRRFPPEISAREVSSPLWRAR